MGTFAVIAVTASIPAMAQQREAAGLAEIIVTVQKREERLIDVPISLAVVSGDTIKDFQITAMDDIDRLVPSLYINATPGNNAIFVRGIGSTAGNLAVEQSVALFVDGIYGGRARQFMTPFLDVERVEVLRGPQGATFGINTSAGAVRITSAKPTKDFYASMRASYEFEFDSQEYGGVLSGPLADGLQGRLAVEYQDIGGYLKNTVTGDDEPESRNFMIRGSVAWQPNDAVSVLAKLEQANFNTYGSFYQRILLPEYVNDDKKENSSFGQKDVDKSDVTNFALHVDVDVGTGTLTSITGFSQFDYDKYLSPAQMPVDTWLTRFQEDFKQFSQEMRYVSASDQTFEYIVGAYYHFNEIDPLIATSRVIFPTTNGPFNGTHVVNFRQDSQVFSVFGNLTWNFTDTWSVGVDLRYTDDQKNAVQERHVVSGFLPPSWADQRLEGERSDTTLDPAVKLQWEPNKDLMVYLLYAQGSKSGGWQGNSRDLTAANWELNGESSENYELGIKTTLLDGRAFIAASIFSTDVEDMQVSQWTGTSFSVTNAGKTNSKGVEVDGSWSISDQWSLQGGFAYLDAKYDDFPGAPCPFDDPTCDPATNNLAGTRLGFAPEWSGNMALTFQQAVVSNWLLRATLALQYRDDIWLDTAGDKGPPYNMQKATTWVDGRVAVGPEDERWTIALYGKNLTDEHTKSHNYPFPFPTNIVAGRQTYVDGTDRFRELGVELNLRF